MKSKKYKFHEDPLIKQRVREQMAGYKKMNEIILQEQRENLPKMTPEESKAIYEDLFLVWEHTQKQNPDRGDLERLKNSGVN